MTGWFLIVCLLVLGGILSTLGDLLGSRVGKARLSIFNLRPRRTAVLITVLTGSLISAISLGLMLLVSRQLRVGLFELDDLQNKLKTSRSELVPLRAERKRLETRINSLRSGNVVITSGQPLATATLRLEKTTQSKNVINKLLQEANLEAFRRVLPGEKPNRQIILVPKEDIKRLESIITRKGTWVVNFRSAANVLLGEKLVYAFSDVRPSLNIFRRGEVIAKIELSAKELKSEAINKKFKLLLASAFAEAKRKGSLASGVQFDPSKINKFGKSLLNRKQGGIEIEAISMRNSNTADPITVSFQIAEKRIRKKK